MTPIAAKVDTDAIVRPGGEWAHFKVNAARLKQQAGAEAHTSRKFANWLLTSSEHGLSEASYPNLRMLLRIMIMVPASSVQSVRTRAHQATASPNRSGLSQRAVWTGTRLLHAGERLSPIANTDLH